jgi:hypothetical protein
MVVRVCTLTHQPTFSLSDLTKDHEMRGLDEPTSDELIVIIRSFVDARSRLHSYVLRELCSITHERGLVIEQETIDAEIPAIVGEVRDLVARLANELLEKSV